MDLKPQLAAPAAIFAQQASAIRNTDPVDANLPPPKVDTEVAWDYASIQARPPIPGPVSRIYRSESLRQLAADFPRFHKSDITALFGMNGGFYTPTFTKCYDCVARNAPVPITFNRFIRMNATTRVPPKNSGKRAVRAVVCQEFEDEYIWTQDWKALYDKKHTFKRKRASDVHARHAMREEICKVFAENQAVLPPRPAPASTILLSKTLGDLKLDEGIPDTSIRIECGCCCDDSTSFLDMMQCPDGHLFCKDCVRMQAETVVGNRGTDILCMDQSNCKMPFTLSVLSQCLDQRTIALWEKIKQAKDIREAKIEGLEDCPFCEYAVVNPFTFQQAPAFHCAKCKVISCRRCKRKEHSGHPCHDQIEEARLKTEHSVEEAMTQALLRTCPNCQAPFIKEHGCNKIVCQSCQSICCYVCRKQILDPHPYHHFVGQGVVDPTKCPLWDGDGSGDPTRRHADEVAAAEKKARLRLQAPQAGPSNAVIPIRT